MIFAIFTHVSHSKHDYAYYAYSPYVREMNVWEKYVDELIIVAPLSMDEKRTIDSCYFHPNLDFIPISSIDLLSVKSVVSFLYKLPKLLWTIHKAMKAADHIHLRCPGNIGLLACFVQVLFPYKLKTAKYAGNWDPNSKQPWSYRLQKWILNNTVLTRNMKVLVYGEWLEQSKNIKPFFTATYNESEKSPLILKDLNSRIKFVFVGTLAKGKNPIYAIELLENLYNKGYDVELSLYGEGIERSVLENYISVHNLQNRIFLKGNQNKEIVKKAYQESHFVILPSESEGWPKAIAEGMFWGCVPIATSVSCVPFMLGYEKRGILLEMNNQKDEAKIISILNNELEFQNKIIEASAWSRNYTLDVFEKEIKQIIKNEA